MTFKYFASSLKTLEHDLVARPLFKIRIWWLNQSLGLVFGLA